MKNLILPFVVLWTFSLQAQTTLVLQPNGSTGNDTFVFDDFPTTSYGTEDRIDVTAWTQTGLPYISRGLIEFDLSSIPVASSILSAHLSLYHHPTHPFYGGIHSGANAIIIQRITTPWNEITTAWNNQPITTTANQVLLPATTSGTQNFIDIDVTPMVMDMVNAPSTSYGFMIRLQVEVQYSDLLIASSNHADPTVHPKLVIEYLTTGINESANEDNNIIAFPNPCHDILNIETSDNSQSEIIIYDLQSKKLLHQEFVNKVSINTANLAGGLYLYEIKNINGVRSMGKILKN